MAVSELRSCYSTKCKFFRDSDRENTIQWYFVPEDTADLPFGTSFTPNVWLDVPEGDQDIGEVPGAPRVWVDGTPPFPVAGTAPCGSEEDFRIGAEIQRIGSAANVFGGYQCCALPLPPFVHFSCVNCPLGSFNQYTAVVAGGTGEYALTNGTFNLTYVGSCTWDGPVFQWHSSGALGFYRLNFAGNEGPFPASLHIQTDHFPVNYPAYVTTARHNCLTLLTRFEQETLVGVDPPFYPGQARSVAVIPGEASTRGPFCQVQQAFLATDLEIQVRGRGPGTFGELIDQDAPLRLVTPCAYTGSLRWSLRAPIVRKVALIRPADLTFLPGGTVELRATAPNGNPQRWLGGPVNQWDGTPLALMLQQPVQLGYNLPQAVTLYTTDHLPG
jgi:hypothetical protein